ncbi:MAG: DUF4261 domain-containing protein [Myxococcota bacterium]
MGLLDWLGGRKDEPRLALCFVLLESHDELNDVVERVTARGHRVEDVQVTSGNVSFRVADQECHVSVMPAPMPWSDLEGPCATAWWWKDAANACRRHQVHVVVSVTSSRGDRFGQRLLLTDVAAAVVDREKGIGVYWGEAPLVQPRGEFLDQAREASREYLPLHLWVDFRIEPRGEQQFLFATSGMRALGHMELEAVHRVESAEEIAEVVDKMFNVAHYLCDHGPVLEHGHTIGMTADEKIRIEHRASEWTRPEKVIRLFI